MAKVICTLPNASTKINGVAFVEHKLGMISEEVSDEVAAGFASIQGYVLHAPQKRPGVPPVPAPTKPIEPEAPADPEVF